MACPYRNHHNHPNAITPAILIAPHTLERAKERGASEREIEDTIRTGIAFPSRHGRIGKAKVYDFNQERLGRRCEPKRAVAIYVVEGDTFAALTRLRFAKSGD